MNFLHLLILNIFLFSFQNTPSLFYCDDILRKVYIVDKSSGNIIKDIGTGSGSGSWDTPNYFYNLEADPGDHIRIICYTPNSGVYGGGCFLVNNICYCYNFYNIYSHEHASFTRGGTLGGKPCNVPLRQRSGQIGDYSYEQTIPLDVGGITCKNYLLIVPSKENNKIKLSDFITANFEVKNLEITILNNFEYFKLDNNKLDSNNKFKILNDKLTFYSDKTEKITITFRNYGIVTTTPKDCSFNIRVCHSRCSNCNDLNASDNNHQCTKCKSGFYLVEDIPNCMTIEEMKGTNYYFDSTAQIFKKCYEDCKTCSIGGNSIDMKCDSCDKPKEFYAEPHNCIDDVTRYYLDEDENIYKKCYKSCYSCNSKSIESENNCTICENKYHFVYNETKKKTCIYESQKTFKYLFRYDN